MRQPLHRRLADRAMETMAVAAVGVATVVATTMVEVTAVLLFWVAGCKVGEVIAWIAKGCTELSHLFVLFGAS